jgi:hypothetical protein
MLPPRIINPLSSRYPGSLLAEGSQPTDWTKWGDRAATGKEWAGNARRLVTRKTVNTLVCLAQVVEANVVRPERARGCKPSGFEHSH